MWKIISAIFLFLSVLAIVLVMKIMQIDKDKQTTANTTQDQRGIIRLSLDAYAGYYPLRSDKMVSSLLSQGYRLDTKMDDGDYEARVNLLEKDEVDLAVFTIDSFILNASKKDFPGTIIAVLSESHGSDALVSKTSEAATLDDLKTNSDLKISYTPKSPSEHLLKVVGAHFGVDHFLKKRGSWRVLADGSEDAREKLLSGKTQAAVLWEPDISKTLEKKGYTKLLGTESTSGIIVDVLVANRKFLSEKSTDVDLFLTTYFNVLKELRASESEFVKGLAKQEGVSRDLAQKMIAGVQWKSLYENAHDWFGINTSSGNSNFGLYKNIEQTSSILIQARDFESSPLPDGDPRRIFLDSHIASLAAKMNSGQSQESSSNITFQKLSDSGWEQLKPIGTLKIEPIPFSSGSNEIDNTGSESIKGLVEKLSNYPNLRILVEGHTGTSGDRQANIELSQERASAVANNLIDKFGITPNRIRAVGIGPDRPLQRGAEESVRAWRSRLSRVEVRFLKETY